MDLPDDFDDEIENTQEQMQEGHLRETTACQMAYGYVDDMEKMSYYI